MCVFLYRCIRFLVRCLGRSAASVLSPLVSMVGCSCPRPPSLSLGALASPSPPPPPCCPARPQVVAVYAAHQHSCFLYLGSVVVDEFGALEAFQPGLLGMLEAFAGVTFPILAAPGGLVQHPDTVDDMYRLCARSARVAVCGCMCACVHACVSVCECVCAYACVCVRACMHV